MTLMDRRLGGFNHRREITVDRREGSPGRLYLGVEGHGVFEKLDIL